MVKKVLRGQKTSRVAFALACIGMKRIFPSSEGLGGNQAETLSPDDPQVRLNPSDITITPLWEPLARDAQTAHQDNKPATVASFPTKTTSPEVKAPTSETTWSSCEDLIRRTRKHLQSHPNLSARDRHTLNQLLNHLQVYSTSLRLNALLEDVVEKTYLCKNEIEELNRKIGGL